jgi:hypothetical protein
VRIMNLLESKVNRVLRMCQVLTTYVSIRQHTSAYVSIRQSTASFACVRYSVYLLY